MATRRTFNPQSTASNNYRLEDELGPAVLEACSFLWQKYSELSEMAPSEIGACRHDLLSWYAEQQFKTRGGAKCSLCRAHVRHALKVRGERHDGSIRTYLCLCTRCLVAEEALSWRVLYRVAGQWVESRRRKIERSATAHSIKRAA